MAWTVVSGNRMPVRLSGSDRKLLKERSLMVEQGLSLNVLKSSKELEMQEHREELRNLYFLSSKELSSSTLDLMSMLFSWDLI